MSTNTTTTTSEQQARDPYAVYPAEQVAVARTREGALVRSLHARELDEDVPEALRAYRRAAQAALHALTAAPADFTAEHQVEYLTRRLDREVDVLVGNAVGRREADRRFAQDSLSAAVEQQRRTRRQKERAEQWQQH